MGDRRRGRTRRTDASALYLEDRSAGLWRVVSSWLPTEIASVQRRFTENDGTWTWPTESLPAPTGAHDRT